MADSDPSDLSADDGEAPVKDEPLPSKEPGERIGGRYEIQRMIGRGGMGEVYAARNLSTGRDVALKLIRATNATPEQNRRFLREAKAATAIQHPNVIEVLDVFEDEDGTPVQVMELLLGETLGQLCERVGPLELGQAAGLLLPVLQALQAAHAKGIVHRDLKPDNIFLSEGPTGEVIPKILDYGIAKVIDPTTIAAETQGGATHTGSILGTPHYMSFEQAMSEKDIDHRADIWAIGVIIFEALAGRRPLQFDNLGQMYTALLQGEVPSIREHVDSIPDDVAELLDQCLAKEREERLDDLAPLIEVLEPHVDPTVVELVARATGAIGPATGGSSGRRRTQGAMARSVGESRSRRGALMVGVALAVVALGVGVVGVGVSGGSSESAGGQGGGGGEQAAATGGQGGAAEGQTTVEPSTHAAQADPEPSSSAPPPKSTRPVPGGPGRVPRPPVAAPKPPVTAAPTAAPTATPTPTRRKGIDESLPY